MKSARMGHVGVLEDKEKSGEIRNASGPIWIRVIKTCRMHV